MNTSYCSFYRRSAALIAHSASPRAKHYSLFTIYFSLILLLFSFTPAPRLSAQTVTHHPQNINLPGNGKLLYQKIGRRWNGTEWENSGIETYTRDSRNNIIQYLLQIWEIAYFIDIRRCSYQYDADNNLIQEQWEEGDLNGFENSVKSIYTYNSNNKLTGRSQYKYSYGSWDLFFSESHTYDSSGTLTETLTTGPDGTNTHLITFTRDAGSNMLYQVLYRWKNDSWSPSVRFITTYDAPGNIIERLSQQWEDTLWDNISRDTYTYDNNNNRIEWLNVHWLQSVMEIWEKETYTYDSNNNLIELVNYSPSNGIFVTNTRNLYKYDDDNNLTEELWQSSKDSGWVNRELTTYLYLPTSVSDVPDAPYTYTLSDSYPNPFNPSASIRYTVPESGTVTLQIFDMLGSHIQTLVDAPHSAGTYTVQFNGTGLPSGIYLYRLTSGKRTAVKKMMLIK